MTVRKRRDRLIALRVTDEELEFLENACESRGGRNLSDFARTELLSALSRSDLRSAGDLGSLEARLKQLEARLLQQESQNSRSAEAEPVPAAETL
jgi:hypothetical protein